MIDVSRKAPASGSTRLWLPSALREEAELPAGLGALLLCAAGVTAASAARWSRQLLGIAEAGTACGGPAGCGADGRLPAPGLTLRVGSARAEVEARIPLLLVALRSPAARQPGRLHFWQPPWGGIQGEASDCFLFLKVGALIKQHRESFLSASRAAGEPAPRAAGCVQGVLAAAGGFRVKTFFPRGKEWLVKMQTARMGKEL